MQKSETDTKPAEQSSGEEEPPAKKGKRTKDQKKTKTPVEKKTPKKKSKPTHPPTVEMIQEALETYVEPDGLSVQAIKSYILSNFKTVRTDMVKSMMKRALKQGLDSGLFSRGKGQEEKPLLSGRYRLAKPTEEDAGSDVEYTPKADRAGSGKKKRQKKVVAVSHKKKKGAAKRKKRRY